MRGSQPGVGDPGHPETQAAEVSPAFGARLSPARLRRRGGGGGSGWVGGGGSRRRGLRRQGRARRGVVRIGRQGNGLRRRR